MAGAELQMSARILERGGKHAVGAGQHKGRKLEDFTDAELRRLMSRGAGSAADQQLTRAYAKAVIGQRELLGLLGDACQPVQEAAEDRQPDPCTALVCYKPPSKRPQRPAPEAPRVFVWPEWPKLLWNISVLKWVFVVTALLLLYPPAAALPARLFGMLFSFLIHRTLAVIQTFREAIAAEVGSLASELWQATVGSLFAFPSGSTGEYPMGGAVSSILLLLSLISWARPATTPVSPI